MENGPRKDCNCPFTQGTERLCHGSFLQKSCFSGGGPRQALPLAKCLGGQSLFNGLRDTLCLQCRAKAAQGPVHYFPSSWCPCSWALLGGTTPSQRPGPRPLRLGHSPQTASEVVAVASFVSSIWEVLCGKKENSRLGIGSSGTGLLQFVRQWEMGPWRASGLLCQLHDGWPWRIASPLSSLCGTEETEHAL